MMVKKWAKQVIQKANERFVEYIAKVERELETKRLEE